MNYVLEAELGLVANSDARIRVGHEAKGWKQGRFVVRDTSFETEITFDGAASNAFALVCAAGFSFRGIFVLLSNL
jgi:hypothetical protein